MGHEEMRAADSDRQAVADKLRVALDEGRLDLHEYDERVQQAYAAKTYGELEVLLTDLPVQAGIGVPPAPPADNVTRRWLVQLWSGYGSVVSITIAIWIVSCIASGDLTYFWPVWVAGPWGLILVWQTVGGLASGEPQRWQAEIDKQERKKELKKQAKRERKALEQGETGD